MRYSLSCGVVFEEIRNVGATKIKHLPLGFKSIINQSLRATVYE